MIDITICKGVECPIKSDCKRFVVKEVFMQNYFQETPGIINEINNKKVFTCDMFWNNYINIESVIFGNE